MAHEHAGSPVLYPIVCLTCLYPLEAGSVQLSGQLGLGLRHPDSVEGGHEIDPGYAMSCAFCHAGGPMWFLAYGAPGGWLNRGAVNLCTQCAGLLARGEVETIVERALGTIEPGTEASVLDVERVRVRSQLEWLGRHGRGPARLALELVPDGAMGAPGPRR